MKMAWVAVLGIALVLSPRAVWAQGEINESVEAGSEANALTITVSNTSTTAPAQGVQVAVAGQPQFLSNIRITPAGVNQLAPGESRTFTITFDVRDDAPAGQSDTLNFQVTAAQGSTISRPHVKVTLRIVKAAVATPPPPTGSTGAARPTAPPLKLVKIEGPRVDPAGLRLTGLDSELGFFEYRDGGSGYVLRTKSRDRTTSVLSVRITKAPLEIVPGQPIEFDVEAIKRRFYPDPHWCRTQSADKILHGPGARIVAFPFTAIAWTRHDLFSYCPEGAASPYPSAVEKDGSLKLTLRLNPHSQTFSEVYKRWNYVYAFEVVSDGQGVRGSNSMGDQKNIRLLFTYPANRYELDVEITPYLESRSEIVGVASGRLLLSYRPVKQGEPVVASLPHYEHPAELLQPPRAGSAVAGGQPGAAGGGTAGTSSTSSGGQPGSSRGTTGTAGSTGTGGSGTPGSGAGGGAVASLPPGGGGTVDPQSPQIAGLINQWISVAEPTDNARGARLRYDEWGRAQGTGVNGEIITPGRRPDAAGGMTSQAYVWSIRSQLDSINHCTLGEFVASVLQGGSAAHCQGRHRAAPSQVVRVERVLHLSIQEAEARLRAQGLVAESRGGDPAPAPGLAFKVYEQDPQPGSQASRGAKVTITVHAAYDARRTVPDLMGLSVNDAQSKLQALGLQASLEGGDAAPSADKQFSVYKQKPGAGSALAPGDKVAITIHGAFTPMSTIPNIVGLPFDQAKARLERAGLTATRQDIGRAPSREQAFTVREQEPGANGQVRPGQQITLKVYTEFEDPRCGPTIGQARSAEGSGRADDALQLYRQAGQLGCNVPNLDSTIAALSQQIQQRNLETAERNRQADEQNRQTRQCNDLVQRGNAASNAGRQQDALNFYGQARQLGCNVPGLDTAIANLERQVQQQIQQQLQQQIQEQNRQTQLAQQCNDLVQRGNAASGRGQHQEGLNAYQQARQLRCNVQGLDNAIANLERQIQQQVQQQNQQAQRCNALIQQGNAANTSGRLQDALNTYRQAKGAGCGSPQLDTTIAQIETRLRSGQGGPARPRSGDIPPTPACPPGHVWAPGGLLGQGDAGSCVRQR